MSCLFRALAHFVPGDDTNLIRQKICNFLALNKSFECGTASEMIQFSENLDLESYVERMRQSHVWGGHIELQTFVELYGLCVVLKSLRQDKTPYEEIIHPRSGVFKRTIYLTWTGNHYEPDRSRADRSSPEPVRVWSFR